jgi:HK97 family phage portal protein
MAVIQSVGALTDLNTGWWPMVSYGSLRMYDEFNYDYATLYRQQPNIRTCVDFLARNIAQLGLHVFRRVGETDRERLRDHPLAVVLDRPLPAEYKMTRYRLIEALMGDLGVYFNAYWLKVPGTPMGLLRIPPTLVTVYGGLVPTRYEINIGGKIVTAEPDAIVHFRGYNPEDPVNGLSPLETLRRVLAEEHAAGDYREHFWQNAARQSGIIERPANAPEWGENARARFKAEFEALYAGGDNSGKTAILEEGMTWRPGTFNAQESEYLAGRKLTREECARAYHIPLPMVGILDNATFSNIQEQHRNLYQDSLGPWMAMIEQDIELQLLPEFADREGVYVEFNIAEKLQGSFQEQTQSLQSAVGRPWMTADEARARMNLPSMGGDAEQLVTPLNVLVGGQASPNDTAPPPKGTRGQGDKGTRGHGDSGTRTR